MRTKEELTRLKKLLIDTCDDLLYECNELIEAKDKDMVVKEREDYYTTIFSSIPEDILKAADEGMKEAKCASDSVKLSICVDELVERLYNLKDELEGSKQRADYLNNMVSELRDEVDSWMDRYRKLEAELNKSKRSVYIKPNKRFDKFTGGC